MTDKTKIVESLRKEAKEEYDQAVESARIVFNERLKAISVVAKMGGGSNGLFDKPTDDLQNLQIISGKTAKWPGFRAAVWEAIEDQNGKFTVHDVVDYVEEKYPGKPLPAISSELWRLRKDHKIVAKKKGKGRRASIYVRAEMASDATEEKEQEAQK
jgi:hypothetical protein